METIYMRIFICIYIICAKHKNKHLHKRLISRKISRKSLNAQNDKIVNCDCTIIVYNWFPKIWGAETIAPPLRSSSCLQLNISHFFSFPVRCLIRSCLHLGDCSWTCRLHHERKGPRHPSRVDDEHQAAVQWDWIAGHYRRLGHLTNRRKYSLELNWMTVYPLFTHVNIQRRSYLEA